MILAGGFGTRLAPVLGHVPKSLAPIRGRPFLDLLLEYLVQQQVARVVFCVGHLHEAVMERYVRWPGIESAFSVEAEPLGTGGALRHALAQVSTRRFFVLNGDSLCHVELSALLRTHVRQNAIATLTLAALPDRQDVGCVEIDTDGKLTSFMEKASITAGRQGFMNAGVYVFEGSAFDAVPMGRRSLEHELIPRWVKCGRCYGFTTTADVIDIGTPDRYAKAQHRL